MSVFDAATLVLQLEPGEKKLLHVSDAGEPVGLLTDVVVKSLLSYVDLFGQPQVEPLSLIVTE